MINHHSLRPVVVAVLAASTFSPALAQDVPVIDAPPVATVSPPSAPAAGQGNSATPVNPEAAAQAAAEQQELQAARARAHRAQQARRVVVRQSRPAPAPAAAAPSPTPTPSATPSPMPSPTAAPTTAPTPTPTQAASTTTTTTTAPTPQPLWLWILLALAVIGAIAAVLTWRRRQEAATVEEEWREPVYFEEPAPVNEPAPVMAEPVAAAAEPAEAVIEDAALTEPAADDVAALTGEEVAADRPWLEFAFRPLAAGVSGEDVAVQIELTVANAGGKTAEDVRIVTHLVGDAAAADAASVDPAVEPIRIEPGEGKRIEATLLLPGAAIGSGSLQPAVVTEARYRVRRGRERRTAAVFEIGLLRDDGAFGPLDRFGGMREDVEARLVGEPERS